MIRRNRHWTQFSLRTALQVVAVIAFGLAMYAFYREHQANQRLRQENKELRDETGEIAIDPGQENLLHAVGMQTLDPKTWRWKLHVPKEGKFLLRATVGQIPRSGNATGDTMSLPLEPGQPALVVLGIRRDLDGKLQWMLEARGQQAQIPVSLASAALIERDSWAAYYTGLNWGGHRILTDASEDFEILRLRVYATPQPPNVPLLNPAPDGIVIWIDREQISTFEER